MLGHVQLVVVECKAGMLLVAGSILGQVQVRSENFLVEVIEDLFL